MRGLMLLLYAACLFFALVGLVTLIIPIVGIFFFGIAFLCYVAATHARRKSRELEVRRQQGG